MTDITIAATTEQVVISSTTEQLLVLGAPPVQQVITEATEQLGLLGTAPTSVAVLSPVEQVVVTGVGIRGPAGPPGGAGGSYNHSQLTSSNVWDVAHFLGFKPNVTTVDSAGTTVVGEVVHVDFDHLTITFSAAFGGSAYLS